jgi:hypothetical protein
MSFIWTVSVSPPCHQYSTKLMAIFSELGEAKEYAVTELGGIEYVSNPSLIYRSPENSQELNKVIEIAVRPEIKLQPDELIYENEMIDNQIECQCKPSIIWRLWKNYFEANSLSFYFGEMKEN